MADKKSNKPEGALNQLLTYGLLKHGNDPTLQITRLNTGIPGLDDILGGGIPRARNTMLVGPESTGKTLIAQWLCKAQQKEAEHSLAALIDVERSFDPIWWAESGVNIEELVVAQPTTGEEAIDIICALFKAPETGIVVLDSIATLTPRYIEEHSAEQMTQGSLAQLCVKMFQKTLPLNDHTIFLMINQVRDSMDKFTAETYPGGRAVRHNSHVILRTRRDGWTIEKERRVGFSMEIQCTKNKTGEPQGSTKVPYRFKGQFDIMATEVDEAIRLKLIRSNPPYYYWGETKIMGKQKLREFFTENPAEFEELEAQLGEVDGGD